MRTYGRIGVTDARGIPIIDPTTGAQQLQWVEVDTAANGTNDLLMVTAMCQTMLLNYGESPIFANWGIPAQQSVLQQIYPDLYMAIIQQQYAQQFASLTIKRAFAADGFTPVYDVVVITHQGVLLTASITIPT